MSRDNGMTEYKDPMCILREFEDWEDQHLEPCFVETIARLRAEGKDPQVDDVRNEFRESYPEICRQYADRLLRVTLAVLAGDPRAPATKEWAGQFAENYERLHDFLAEHGDDCSQTELLRHIARMGKFPDEQGMIEIRLRRWIKETFDRLLRSREFAANDDVVAEIKRDHPAEYEAHAGAGGDAKVQALLRHTLFWDMGLLAPLEPEDLAAMTPEQRRFVANRYRKGAEDFQRYLKLLKPYLEGHPERTLGEAEDLLRRRMLQ